MATLTRKRAAWVCVESTYGSDPSTNGSGYKFVPALMVGDLTNGKVQLPTNYATGRQFPTAPIPGMDGWSIDLEVPVIGLATAAGDGVNSSATAVDWADAIWLHIFGSLTDNLGEGLASGSGSGTIILDTDVAGLGIQSLIPVFESTIPAGGIRTQWALVSVDNASATYSVVPNWASTPSTAAVMYGAKNYRITDAGGSSLAFVIQDDDVYYTCLGGRITSWSIVAETGQINKLKISISGDTRAEDTSAKSALPAAAVCTPTPTTALLSPVAFNGTYIATKRIEINGGLQVAELLSSAAANGRSNWQNVSMAPQITIEPLYADSYFTSQRAATTGRALVQLGGGVGSGGPPPTLINSVALSMEEAVIASVTKSDDQGVKRQVLQISATDKIYFSASNLAQFFQLARA